MGDIFLLVLLDLLTLEVRLLESCVIVTTFSWDSLLKVVCDRRVRFSPCIISAHSVMIQGAISLI